MLWELFSSPQYFSTICARHVLPRTNETTVKFLTQTCRDVRENVLKIRGEENVPEEFLLIECASRESIELGWNELIDSEGYSVYGVEEKVEKLCRAVISRARKGKNIHPLLFTHALEESEMQRIVLEERLVCYANDALNIE